MIGLLPKHIRFNSSLTDAEQGRTPATLPDHLLSRGLLQGKHSDISILAFGHTYKLHRIILDRAPFFASALSEPWCEASQKEVQLHPEEIDPHITLAAFELALNRLYGLNIPAVEIEEAMGLFATGCWLEMQDLVDDSVESILRHLGQNNLAQVIHVVTTNYYGKSGDRILASAKAMLCRNGSDMPIKAWDELPSELIQELISSDGFFVRDEWSRWRLAKRLLDRRLKIVARDLGLWKSHSKHPPSSIRTQALRPPASSQLDDPVYVVDDAAYASVQSWEHLYSNCEIQPLLKLLDESIHYAHLDFEQLQCVRNARDALGFPLLPNDIVTAALWANLELRQRILNATEKELTLGLMHYVQNPSSGSDAQQVAANSDIEMTDAGLNDPSTGTAERSGDSEPPRKEPSPARRWAIPTADCNILLGGSEEPIYTNQNADSHTCTVEAPRKVESAPLDTELDDGTTTVSFQAKNLSEQGGGRTTAYSSHPPFRFAVEFPNARLLKDRKKVFSHTVFYAGSLWNVYIKKVKSSTKNPHLGVYLHRAPQHQNMKQHGYVQRGSVDERIGALEYRMQQRNPRSAGQTAAPTYLSYEQNMSLQDTNQAASGVDPHAATDKTIWRRSDQPTDDFAFINRLDTQDSVTSSFDDANDDSSDSDSNENATIDLESLTYQPRPQISALTPYIDARPTIKTYFKIYSPSRGGRMLSVYESVPDKFNFSQSWGWKSSTLMVDEGDEDRDDFTLPETSFVDDDAVGAELLETGEGMASPGAGGHGLQRKRRFSGKSSSSSRGLRFMIVLGVV